MLCPDSIGLNNNAFLSRFNARAIEQCVPVNGGMDLTSGCNLKCRHCYISANDSVASESIPEDTALRIIDEAVAAGCLFFLMTGGEPLMHPAFGRIYSHAKQAGLIVTVFTNGTLIDENIIALFSEYPPLGVELSVYGATAQTHDAITGVAGSFVDMMSGLEMLKKAGIKVDLKTMLMTLNEHEFEGMKALAEGLDVKFRTDAALFPRLSGDSAPTDVRVTPERAVECEFSFPGRKEGWMKFVERMSELPSGDSLYVCGAGRTSFHVNAKGCLQPCIMTPHISEDLGRASFGDAWKKVSETICGLRADGDNPCAECKNRLLCESCPGFIRLETGEEQGKLEYLCGLAEGRASILSKEVGT